ncbi:unnamed protein product [Nippostrongylus brasiliensis]|uniref:SEA domain-containing protein n=1 Tax=Nippostrongylus brasiliensis TaxID=27835 RepID=A0A3P7C7L3_NIPBR|nr:unnamed protein product [Nippostrongylus brasiliensis]
MSNVSHLQVTANGGKIAKLKVADDFKLLDPCKVEDQVVYGTMCGSSVCNDALGEECIAGKLCGCPKGQKRKDAQSPCRVVESFNLPLYVIRDGGKSIKYTPSLANPQDDTHKDLVDRFEVGIAQSYNNTPLKNGFVTVEVNDIEEPSNRNAATLPEFYTEGHVEPHLQVVELEQKYFQRSSET